MAATLAANGLQAALHPSGVPVRPTLFNATTYSGTTTKLYNTATTYYSGQPLVVTAAGIIDVAGTVAGAGSITRIYGVFQGVEFTGNSGRREVSSWYQDSFASTTLNPDVWFWVYTDPNLTYEIQATGAFASTAVVVGSGFNFSANTGFTPSSGVVIPGGVGYSTTALNPTAVATGANAQMRILEVGRGIGNAINDAFPRVRVQLSNFELYAPATAQ